MPTIYEELTREEADTVYDVSSLPPTDAGSPPVEPPEDKTYGGEGDDEGDETPAGANVVLDARQIYAGLYKMCNTLGFKHFDLAGKPEAVAAFIQGYNEYKLEDWDGEDWQGLDQ